MDVTACYDARESFNSPPLQTTTAKKVKACVTGGILLMTFSKIMCFHSISYAPHNNNITTKIQLELGLLKADSLGLNLTKILKP